MDMKVYSILRREEDQSDHVGTYPGIRGVICCFPATVYFYVFHLRVSDVLLKNLPYLFKPLNNARKKLQNLLGEGVLT